MRTCLRALLLVATLAPSHALAQAPLEWKDGLVDHMTGDWTMTEQVMGRDAHHAVQAEWVLNHQFLRIHEKTSRHRT